MRLRRLKSLAGNVYLRLSIYATMAFLVIFLALVISRGYSVIDFGFIAEGPRDGMTNGGIFPAIAGTFFLVVISTAFAVPLGVLAAVFLVEYASPRWLVNVITTAINTLAGIPSIVFGLFGLALFVNLLDLGTSMLSGGLTLGVLILPIIINSTIEAIRSVPMEFREAGLALGATKRQMILKVVLPAALPNILTGGIISVGRAAGETAPILFTAATFYTRRLPESVFDEVMALPYHIYALMTEGTKPEFHVPIAYGTAIVLLGLVLLVNLSALIIRYKIRRRRSW